MTPLELAYAMVTRLNGLMEDPEVAFYVNKLAEEGRINVSQKVADHPTLQVLVLNDGIEDFFHLGFLGLLNGMVGVIPSGPREGWGHITLVDNRWFTVSESAATVDDIAGNPDAFMGLMLKVTGTVSSVRRFGQAVQVYLKGDALHMNCFLSKPELGPDFPTLAVGQELTLYGIIEPREGSHVFRAFRQFPGRSETSLFSPPSV
jgi:hypothetical protein